MIILRPVILLEIIELSIAVSFVKIHAGSYF